ncbi:MAG: hypothetical protein CL908_16600 [Deltaproteobacteria bacterium]|jgi:hypothetical protein|nr:hypothetical protein [Deltaproteobacteria bacterium]
MRFFFIVGPPRSGTTLLRRMLDAQPEIAVTPETHFGERYVRKRLRFGPDGEAASREALLDDFCASRGFRLMGLDETSFRVRARRFPGDPWHPLRTALEAFGERERTAWVGEKTPSHALHLLALAEAFPGSCFVLLSRDPRAVVASWQNVDWSTRSPVEAAEIWRRYMLAMRRARARLTDRCGSFTYEELVSNPEVVLRGIGAFLGTQFDPLMSGYHDHAYEESPEEPRGSLTFSPPAAARVDAWREAVTPFERARLEAICAGEMRRAGYARESSIRSRLRAATTTLLPLWRKRIVRTWKGRSA